MVAGGATTQRCNGYSQERVSDSQSVLLLFVIRHSRNCSPPHLTACTTFSRHLAASSARQSLAAFSRDTSVDGGRAVERRLQKLWRGPDEVMVSSKRPASLPRSVKPAPLDRSQPRVEVEKPGESRTSDEPRRSSHRKGNYDWQAAASSAPQALTLEPGEGDAAVRVLADHSLWTSITDFMTGLPLAVLQFEKRAARKHVVRNAAPYTSKIFFALDEIEDWFPKPVGVLPQLAIAEDNLKILQMLHKLRQSPHYRANSRLDFGELMRCAIWYKRWGVLKWLARVLPHDPAWQWEPNLLSYALFQRNLSLMNWLFEVCPDASIELSARQVEIRESGRLEVVRWLHEHDYKFSAWMMNAAAAKGSLDVVQFLLKHRSEGCTIEAMDLAARYGHRAVVRFLHANRTKGCSSKASEGAAQSGDVDSVHFPVDKRNEGCISSATHTE